MRCFDESNKTLFTDKTIQPNTLYKKLKFEGENLFITLTEYIIKNIEFKITEITTTATNMGCYNVKILISPNIFYDYQKIAKNIDETQQDNISYQNNYNPSIDYNEINTENITNKLMIRERLDNNTTNYKTFLNINILNNVEVKIIKKALKYNLNICDLGTILFKNNITFVNILLNIKFVE